MFSPHRTPVSFRAWDGWCFSNEHLFNIWFSPPFAACCSRDHYSNPAMNTELFVCKLFFSQCSLLNTSVLHKCNFASLRWGGRKEKQIVRQKKPFHWSEGILLQMHTLQSKCTNKFKHLAVYLMKRWGTACSRVHVLAAEGLHAAAVLASEQGCAAPALPAAR